MTDTQKSLVAAKTETAAPASMGVPAVAASATKNKAAVKKAVKAPAKPRKTSPAKPAPAAAKAAKAVETPKALKAATPPAAAKPAKQKKAKLVRDSFTIPKTEYLVLDELKQRAAKLGHPAKKSELLRAGIKALAAMDVAAFAAALHSVPAIKTGRPKQD